MEDGNHKVEEETNTKIMVSSVLSVINCIIQLMSYSKHGFPPIGPSWTQCNSRPSRVHKQIIGVQIENKEWQGRHEGPHVISLMERILPN